MRKAYGMGKAEVNLEGIETAKSLSWQEVAKRFILEGNLKDES